MIFGWYCEEKLDAGHSWGQGVKETGEYGFFPRGFKMFWGRCQAKVVDCEKFIKGQKVIYLTRITGNMLLSSWRNSWSHQLVLKSLYLDQRSQVYCLCNIWRQSGKEITWYYIILLWCTSKTCLHFSQTQFNKTILRLNRFLIFNAGLVALL